MVWSVDPKARLSRRAFAVLGALWIVGVLTFLLLQERVPVLWKMAWALYGGFGLVDMAATWTGKDEVWGKELRRAQIVAFLIAVLLFAIGATRFRQAPKGQ